MYKPTVFVFLRQSRFPSRLWLWVASLSLQDKITRLCPLFDLVAGLISRYWITVISSVVRTCWHQGKIHRKYLAKSATWKVPSHPSHPSVVVGVVVACLLFLEPIRRRSQIPHFSSTTLGSWTVSFRSCFFVFDHFNHAYRFLRLGSCCFCNGVCAEFFRLCSFDDGLVCWSHYRNDQGIAWSHRGRHDGL